MQYGVSRLRRRQADNFLVVPEVHLHVATETSQELHDVRMLVVGRQRVSNGVRQRYKNTDRAHVEIRAQVAHDVVEEFRRADGARGAACVK